MTHEHETKGHGRDRSDDRNCMGPESHPFPPLQQDLVAGQAPSTSTITEQPAKAPSPWEGARGWKGLLSVLALMLSALIWIGGLSESLSRPSVVNALDIRQMELAVLAAEALPSSLRPLLVGNDPRGTLIEALTKLSKDSASPPLAAQRLELVLLQRSKGEKAKNPQAPALAELTPQVDAPRRPLLKALDRPTKLTPQQQEALLAPWGERSLVAQLGCEQLGGPTNACPASRLAPWLLLRLFTLTLFPALLMMAGVVLLVRRLWLLQRGLLPSPPPLVGPPLSVVDATLLIAGGFVLLGEVFLPALTQGPLQRLLSAAGFPAATRQGVEVLGSYLTLMLAPLAILFLMLRGKTAAPRGGWLQWGWKPLKAVTVPAFKVFLMMLPLVALVSWLLQLVWADPGGSNPLLEMVLNSSDGVALLAFALTAVVLAPVFEETLFRGVLLPVLGRYLGPVVAVLMSALVFATAHLSLGELVPLTVLGMGLGVLRWQSGRLSTSVCLHALWNSLTFLNLVLLAR
ncbi:MAG: lysostaphin resistance A-like protein [Cyanobium sp.]